MRILFVSPDIEEKARGINMILKSLIISAKEQGHEIGLLVGYPHGSNVEESKSIKTRINHLQLQHYMREGRGSFRYMAPGGYKKLNVLKSLLTLSIFRTRGFRVDQQYLSDDAGMLNQLDFVVQSPYYYQFLVRNYRRIPRSLLRKITKKYDVDLVICASPTLLRSSDVKGGKIAHFVHDVMPIELIEAPPDNNTPSRYGKQFFSTATKSDLIFTNSKDTASKVKEINEGANVHVLYGVASSRRENVGGSSILENKNLKSKHYLLFASTLEKRKNLENLFEAYALVSKKMNMPLVVVGGPGYGFDDIVEKYESMSDYVKNHIIFTGYISEADKYALYDNAFAFTFPSIYEGIGLVIIEAMEAGIPVITSNRGALPEAGGDAALYVENPYDPEEISEAILKVYKDSSMREDMIDKGHDTAKKFTFDKFKSRFKKAMESIDDTKGK